MSTLNPASQSVNKRTIIGQKLIMNVYYGIIYCFIKEIIIFQKCSIVFILFLIDLLQRKKEKTPDRIIFGLNRVHGRGFKKVKRKVMINRHWRIKN